MSWAIGARKTKDTTRAQKAMISQKIHYAEEMEEMEALVAEIRGSEAPFLGFDVEMVDTRVNGRYVKGGTGKTLGPPSSNRVSGQGGTSPRGIENNSPAVMIQLATRTDVYLFHLWKFLPRPSSQDLSRERGECAQGDGHPSFPEGLRKLLRADTITKVGFATNNDTAALSTTFGVNPGAVVDLKPLLSNLRYPVTSLADVALMFTGRTLDKSQAFDWTRSLSREVAWVTSSPGERRERRISQVEYAALDAIVCQEAYSIICNRGLAPFSLPPGREECDRILMQWLERKNALGKPEENIVQFICSTYYPWFFSDRSTRRSMALEFAGRLKKQTESAKT
jgi:hypothetical protein